jgi:hypothetical protein
MTVASDGRPTKAPPFGFGIIKSFAVRAGSSVGERVRAL